MFNETSNSAVSASNLSVSYDRNAAVNFAASYYNQVCPDGFYSTTSNCELSDCAHFVSYALKMGGIPMPQNSICNKTYYGYLGSIDLSLYLYNNGYADKLIEIPVAGSSTWESDIVNFLSNHNGDHFSIPSNSNCYGCTTSGYGSYDNTNYGPIGFIKYMGASTIDHFSYYHIKTDVANQPPTLSSASVSPSSGTTSTTFTYSINYYDPEGASPTTRYAYIDGVPYPMSGSGSGSTYTFQKSGLSAGTHNYYFEFSDGTNTVKFPSSGTLSGPMITSAPSSDSIGVYRPSSCCFYLRNSDGTVQTILFGLPTGDKPIVGKWN